MHGRLSTSGPGVRDPACLTYEAFFGLREKPFSLSPNPRFFFRTRSRGWTVDALVAGIRRREGILALTGEVGTGKTTICRAVLETLDGKTFAAFVPDPFVSREDLLKILLVDFGVVSSEDVKSDRLRTATRTELSYTLYDFLTSLQPLRAFAVVVIDEAQNLSAALLEEIRILSDLEREDKLLQFVLVGQPEFDSRLASPELRQLAQRLAVRVHLDPMDREEIAGYIAHRLAVAGNESVPFDKAAIDAIWMGSKGIPRIINLLCDNALSRAAAAQASGITAEHIVDAAAALRLPLDENDAVATPKLAKRDGVRAGGDADREADGGRASQDANRRRSGSGRQGLPAAYEMRHDAHYVEELESRAELAKLAADAAGVASVQGDALSALIDRSSRMTVSRSRLAISAAAVTLAVAGIAGYLAITKGRSSNTDEANLPPAGASANVVTLNAPAAPPPRSIELTSPAPAETSAPRDTGSGFAIQVATFQRASSAAESVRELKTAGFEAFDVEVPLRSGGRAHAVFLGPYSDRPSAARDYERALEIPGYTAGRIVELGNPATSAPR